MDYTALGLFGLFLIAFISATLVPLASEGVFVAYLVYGYDPLLCFALATSGNTLGSYLNYGIGRMGNPKWLIKFGISESKMNRFESLVKRYGHWSGLMAWIPFIGDPLTVAMGFFRTKVLATFSLVFIGKALRYAVIYWMWVAL